MLVKSICFSVQLTGQLTTNCEHKQTAGTSTIMLIMQVADLQ